MLGFWGEVVHIIEDKKNIQFLSVRIASLDKTIEAIYYISFGQRCALGEWVKVNITALQLGLGTGGYGFVLGKADLHDEEMNSEDVTFPGHIIKLRYTPWQTPVLACEAPESSYHPLFKQPFNLEGKYIFLGELHSMLPVLVSLLKKWDAKRKIAYLMDDQAALFSSFSHHLHYLQENFNLAVITYGQSLGGDLEAINVYTALETAHKVVQADDIIITQGPGVVGTRTTRGFSGMQLVHWLHAVHTCGGQGLVIPRIQFTDRRARHNGVSEHTLYPLAEHTLASATLAYPFFKAKSRNEDKQLSEQLDNLRKKHEVIPIPIESFQEVLVEAIEWYGQPIMSMGKSYTEEPYFFYAIGASFQLYKERLTSLR